MVKVLYFVQNNCGIVV